MPANAPSKNTKQMERHLVRFDQVALEVNLSEPDPKRAGIERYVGLEHLDPRSLRIARWGDIADGTSFTKLFHAGQVLFGKRRAYQRKAAIAEFNGVCSGDILVFESKGNLLLPGLLPYVVSSDGFVEHALHTSAGSLSPRTKFKDLSRYAFPLPTPEEQATTLELLRAIEAVIDRRRALIAALQNQLETERTELFRSESGKRAVKQQLGTVLGYASDGPFGSKLKSEHYANTGARVIRLQNIGDGTFDDTDKAFISDEYFEELARYAVWPGDVIVAGLGDETNRVGRVCQFPDGLGNAINKADCFCLRTDPSALSQKYLLHYLNSPVARVQIARRAQGTTRTRINVQNLKQITIEVPAHDEQRRVCAILDATQSALQTSYESLQADGALLIAVRERMFTGGITHV